MTKEIHNSILEELYNEKESDEEIYIDADIHTHYIKMEFSTEFEDVEEANTAELAKCKGKFNNPEANSETKKNMLKDIEEQIFDLERKRFFSDELFNTEITEKINSLMKEYTRIENEI